MLIIITTFPPKISMFPCLFKSAANAMGPSTPTLFEGLHMWCDSETTSPSNQQPQIFVIVIVRHASRVKTSNQKHLVGRCLLFLLILLVYDDDLTHSTHTQKRDSSSDFGTHPSSSTQHHERTPTTTVVKLSCRSRRENHKELAVEVP